uniref:Uncharacterized protein n=1 Tax=Globisporangium ultimum (strain ATCC 200006 / CBS 805.95 / DAOM BR144) TaxID=431595 RepID=K3W7M8_GLOUD
MAQKTSAVRQVQIRSEGISCGYPSRHCKGPRARRRNGKLHRFCEYNRDKVNLHQRALEERR